MVETFPKALEFEKQFVRMVGAKYAHWHDSNTAGQDLVIKALGLKGCDIISPTMSFMTTAVVLGVDCILHGEMFWMIPCVLIQISDINLDYKISYEDGCVPNDIIVAKI